MNERLLVDMTDGLINEAGYIKLALQKDETALADYHMEKLIMAALDLRRTLFLETHRSGEVV